MAGFTSTYLANALISHTYGKTTFTAAGTLYVALFTIMPTAAGGGTEPSGSGYARVAVTNNSSNFPVATGQQDSNASLYDFGTPTGSGWGTIVGAAYFDAASGGNMYHAGPFTLPRSAINGVNFSIPAFAGVVTQI